MSVPFVPEDDVLERQLAHLDALERRETDRRVEANEGELERLRSQWVHVVSNLERLRPEEIDAVVESQARLRETIANDAALHEVLRSQHEQLIAWSEALASPLTDPALVRRLLDDISVERVRSTQKVTTSVVDLLTTLLLDMEIVERRVSRDPGSAATLLQDLRDRFSGATARIRDHAHVEEPARLLPGEPLQRALRRLADAHAAQVAVEVQWQGGEVRDPEVALAVVCVVGECLGHLASVQGTSCRVEVDAGAAATSVRVVAASAPSLLPDGEPGWLVRARARAALAGGRVLCGRAGEGSVVEVRF